jgi:hypothetical protein
MKVTVIEGTPEELADYEARTRLIGSVRTHSSTSEPGEESSPGGVGRVVRDTDTAGGLEFWSFILGRAREPRIAGHVESYIRRVLDLGGTEVELGTSKSSTDGRADYLLVYDAGPRHYGAAAYINARNAGLTLRLKKEDMDGFSDARVKLRNVQSQNGYQVNCPVTTPDAIHLAVKLTELALDKVRRLKNGDDSAD